MECANPTKMEDPLLQELLQIADSEAEESYSDCPYSIHWKDELLLQASQAFSKKQGEEEDALLLVASQDYEKQCGSLMTSDDIQSAVVAQVPLNTKRNNNGQLIPGKRGPLDAMLHRQPNG